MPTRGDADPPFASSWPGVFPEVENNRPASLSLSWPGVSSRVSATTTGDGSVKPEGVPMLYSIAAADFANCRNVNFWILPVDVFGIS
jgi:hypothetical protein